MRLLPQQEHLVLENKGLIGAIISSKFKSYSHIYDDLFSVGKIGLVKAAITYDSEKNTKFSTYSARCIENEIRMFLRKEYKHEWTLSLDAPIGSDDEENISLEDVISDPLSDFHTKIESDDENLYRLKRIIEFSLNNFQGIKRLVILYFITGRKQSWIENNLKISQSYVSRIEKQFLRKAKKELNNEKKQYEKEFFAVNITKKAYRITFSSKEASNFNKAFATFLRNIDLTQHIPNFEMSCNEGKVSITIFSDIRALEFVANIIEQIDNFNLTLETLVGNEIAQTPNLSAKADKNEIESSEKEEVSFNEDAKKPAQNRKKRDGSKTKQIREYIMSKDEFTRAELKSQFPDFEQGVISCVLHQAKSEGLIVSTERGKYSVKK